MSTICKMNKNCQCNRCLSQQKIYARTLYPKNKCTNVTEFNSDLINVVEFQNNPYFGNRTERDLHHLKNNIHKCDKNTHNQKSKNKNHMWYHNNSADFGPDTLYPNPYMGSRNPYYEHFDSGAGVPYYTSKYRDSY